MSVIYLQTNQAPEMEKWANQDMPETEFLQKKMSDSESLGTGKRVLVTIVMFGLMSSLAIEYGIFGPTLYDMQIKTGSSIQSISFLFTVTSISSLVSSFVFGPLFDKVDAFFLMGITTIISSVALGAAPYFDSLGSFLGLLAPAGINGGTVPIGSMLLASALWEKYSSSMYQAVNLVYSSSLSLGPLLAKPFLIDDTTDSETTLDNSSLSVIDAFVSSSETDKEKIKVQYVYTITAINMGVWGLLSLLTFCCFYGTIRKPTLKKKEEENDDTKPNTKKFNIIGYICFFIFNIFSGAIDASYDGYLLTFAVTHLNWTKDSGVYITLVYQLSYLLATFIGIFIVRYIEPKSILLLDLFLCFGSSFLLCLTVNSYSSSLWIFSTLIGLGYGTISPCAIAWAESENMKGGLFNGIFYTGIYAGGMAVPPLIGYLYEAISPMTYLYTTLGCFIVMFIMYFVFALVIKLNRKGKL